MTKVDTSVPLGSSILRSLLVRKSVGTMCDSPSLSARESNLVRVFSSRVLSFDLVHFAGQSSYLVSILPLFLSNTGYSYWL